MNPEAPSYVPSFLAARSVPVAAPTAPPQVPPSYRTVVEPYPVGRQGDTASSGTVASHSPPPAPASRQPLTLSLQPTDPTASLLSPHAPIAGDSAAHSVKGGVTLTSSSSSPSPLSSSSPAGRRVRYTKEQLRAIEPVAMDWIRRGGVVDSLPFLHLPVTFAPLLQQPFALEYVDVNSATALVEGQPHHPPDAAVQPSSSSFASTPAHSTSGYLTGNEATDIRNYHCQICAQGGPEPCPALADVIRTTSKYVMSTRRGACLMQSADVVWGLLQLALVFEAKQSSMRLRLLAERHPHIVRLVAEYLCGEGYLLPLPPIIAHDEWKAMMTMLKFDAIRDNRTRIITDVSKHWKKRHTQFEQFVFFFGFRDHRPPSATVKNVVTRSVKPGMVAMLSGDLQAMLLLHRLGFFIPPGYYWEVFPFLRQALGDGTLAYDVVRHLGLYLSSKQDNASMFNPIEPPRTASGGVAATFAPSLRA